jgi:hypothetical protein
LLDANDLICQLDAAREQKQPRAYSINQKLRSLRSTRPTTSSTHSELGIIEQEIKRAKRGKL